MSTVYENLPKLSHSNISSHRQIIWVLFQIFEFSRQKWQLEINVAVKWDFLTDFQTLWWGVSYSPPSSFLLISVHGTPNDKKRRRQKSATSAGFSKKRVIRSPGKKRGKWGLWRCMPNYPANNPKCSSEVTP